MRTIQELMMTVEPGRKVFVRADDLDIDEEAFDRLASGWLLKPEGFTVLGEPYREKASGKRRIEVMWLMRNLP